MNEVLIGVGIAIAIMLLLLSILKKPLMAYLKALADKTIQEGLDRNKQLLDAQKELIDEKLRGGEQSLSQKKDAIKDLVDEVKARLLDTQNKIELSEKERVGAFANLKTIIEEHKTATAGLKEATDNLKNILSNNQSRGKYGEEMADSLLQSVGFVKGQNYVANTSQETISTRPDFTILLPDGTKLNIDVKFPFQALLKYQDADDEVTKKKYLKEFESDVKQKIKQVATRDYINPEEKTLDFAVLFVPNEMIFGVIYDKFTELWHDAMKQKVILAGPFSFTAILRMIYQAYKNFKYGENIQEIVKLMGLFEKEFQKYNEEFDTLGNRLKSVSDQYDKVAITRTKKLAAIVEKIRGENTLPAGTAVIEPLTLESPARDEE